MAGILDVFLPRERKFFDMFDVFGERIAATSADFLWFVRAYNRLSKVEKKAFLEKMREQEEKCDALRHQLSIQLNSTFITPFDREDMHRLSTLLDDIIDVFFNTTEKMLLYSIRSLPHRVVQLAQIVDEASRELQPLLTAVRRKHRIGRHLEKIHRAELMADSLRNEALAHIFNNGEKPLNVIKFKDIYEALELITDKAEDVADVIENIVIKHG